jgi:hypothetical protein
MVIYPLRLGPPHIGYIDSERYYTSVTSLSIVEPLPLYLGCLPRANE